MKTAIEYKSNEYKFIFSLSVFTMIGAEEHRKTAEALQGGGRRLEPDFARAAAAIDLLGKGRSAGPPRGGILLSGRPSRSLLVNLSDHEEKSRRGLRHENQRSVLLKVKCPRSSKTDGSGNYEGVS